MRASREESTMTASPFSNSEALAALPLRMNFVEPVMYMRIS